MENQKPQLFNNLTKDETKALQELSERDDIMITKADKAGALVIVDVKNYIREAESQLKKIIMVDYNMIQQKHTTD